LAKSVKAYRDPKFINSEEARALRILAEYVEPKSRLDAAEISDTVVFFGSARLKEDSPWCKAAHDLAYRLTQWSKGLAAEQHDKRFVVCSGGGPGIMQAANRGASEAGGVNIGMSIALPREEHANPYITRELAFHFHYFFMRKFWLVYLAKAVVVFPGGYGTFDELFEVLTLVQTGKITKDMPIVLFGKDYWNEVVNFEALARHGVINPEDVNLMHRTDSVDDAYDYLLRHLSGEALANPGPKL
jgi:uncharacterized protein (TIGR00730 family)